MCGALSRLSSGICANCNNVLNTTTSSSLTAVIETVPPAAVSENFDYINAEHVITKLNSVMNSIAPVSETSALSATAAQSPGGPSMASPLEVYTSSSAVTDNNVGESGAVSAFPVEAVAAASVAAVLPAAAAMALESAKRVLQQPDSKQDQRRKQVPVGDFFDEVRVPRPHFEQANEQQLVAATEALKVLEGLHQSARFVEDCKQSVERTLQDASIVTPKNFVPQSKVQPRKDENVLQDFSSENESKTRRRNRPKGTDSGWKDALPAGIKESSWQETEAFSGKFAPAKRAKTERDEQEDSLPSVADSDHFVLKLPKRVTLIASVIFVLIGFFLIKGVAFQPDQTTNVPLVDLSETKSQAKAPALNRRVVLTQADFLGEYKFRLTEYSGLNSEGSLLLRSKNGNTFSGEAIINHAQARDLVNNANGTHSLNTVLTKQVYSVSGTCANSNVLSMRLIPKVTSFRPLHIDAVVEFNSNRFAMTGGWYPEPVRVWARPSVRYAFQAIQTKALASSSSDWFKSVFWNDSDSMHTRFLKILALCLMTGLAIAWTSIKFFGMDGLLSRWERDKYIPNSKLKEHQKLLRDLSPAKANRTGSLFLGIRSDWKIHDPLSPKSLYLTPKLRALNPHMLVLGAGAKGKSRLLANLIADDIRHGDRAVVVIDSDGSLIDLLLGWAASQPDGKQLANRIQVIDPCKRESYLGYNPLIANDFESISSHAASIVMGFKAVYTESQNSQNQWTQQTGNILRNALILLILNRRSLSDLPLLLSDNDFRDLMLQQVEREHPHDWKIHMEAWSNYKKLARSEQWINWIEPILNRVQPLLSEPRLSRLLNEREHAVDLEDVLSKKNVLLVRVPEGQLHKGGNLLGSLIITGLRQAAIQQFENEGSETNPCSIFVDELNNFFDAELFDAVSSETRKLQIGIIGTLRTLQDLSEEFRNRAVLSFGSMALFSIAKKDADILGPTMFRVDGRRIKKWNIREWFNPVNSLPTTDLVSDEEKFNIDRLLGQPERSYFCYLVGSQAGVFRMTSREFQDISKDKINWDLIDKIYEPKQISDDEACESDEP